MRNNKLIAIIALTLFFNLFLFHSFGNLGFVIWAFGVFLFFSFLFRPAKKQFLVALFVLSLLSMTLVLRANVFVIFLLSATILFLLFSYVYLSVRHLSFFRSWQEVILSPVKIAEEYVSAFLKGLFASRDPKNKVPHRGFEWRVLMRGAMIAFPIVLVLVFLLTAADPIYGKFIRDIFIFQIDLKNEIWQRTIFSSIIFLIFLPFIFFKLKEENPPVLKFLHQFSIVSEMEIVMCLIGAVLASFLVIQFPYVFVNVARETSLVQFGVNTYSEYVRRGFVELIFASVVVYSTVWLGLISLRHGKIGNKKILIYLQLGVIAELLIFIFSLFRRIWLYQSLHGWSLVRIYGGIFLVWLIFMIITLAWRHFAAKHWVLKEGIFTFFIILFVGFFNAEGFIATSSHPPTVNGRVDYVYLSRLSPDGYEGWKKAYKYAQEVLVLRALQDKALINRDERRDVIYAGFVIDNLFKEYHDQIMTYGTNDEVRNYYLFLIINDDDASDSKQKTIAALEGMQVLNGIKAYINVISPNTFLPTISSCASGRRFYVINYDSLAPRPISKTFLDELFIWNLGNKGRMIKMTREINLGDLLFLQERYCELNQKILNQPASERDFEFDISLDSPFLD